MLKLRKGFCKSKSTGFVNPVSWKRPHYQSETTDPCLNQRIPASPTFVNQGHQLPSCKHVKSTVGATSGNDVLDNYVSNNMVDSFLFSLCEGLSHNHPLVLTTVTFPIPPTLTFIRNLKCPLLVRNLMKLVDKSGWGSDV